MKLQRRLRLQYADTAALACIRERESRGKLGPTYAQSTKTVSTAEHSFYLVRRSVTSGASRNIRYFRANIPYRPNFGKLFFRKKWAAGRHTANGRIICRTKGALSATRTRRRFIMVLPAVRYLNIGFIGGLFMASFSKKTYALIFFSSGSVSYIQASINHELFTLTKLYSIFSRQLLVFNKLIHIGTFEPITQGFFTIAQLPKNAPISALEVFPGRGVQYARSLGAKSLILKMDSRVRTSIVKLPSGAKKTFSVFSVASLGSAILRENKYCRNTKAGVLTNSGRKPLSRGVAKNPIDHPHGGRNSAIKYQRTPWGKTTKYK